MGVCGSESRPPGSQISRIDLLLHGVKEIEFKFKNCLVHENFLMSYLPDLPVSMGLERAE